MYNIVQTSRPTNSKYERAKHRHSHAFCSKNIIVVICPFIRQNVNALKFVSQ